MRVLRRKMPGKRKLLRSKEEAEAMQLKKIEMETLALPAEIEEMISGGTLFDSSCSAEAKTVFAQIAAAGSF